MWIPRQTEAVLISLAQGFPILALTGPRQSGKTALARRAFPAKPYVTLEDPDQRLFAQAGWAISCSRARSSSICWPG